VKLKTSGSFYKSVQLLTCTALASSWAYATDTPAPQAPAEGQGEELQEIIVTAQKREQSSIDVPIAISVVTQEALQANRVTSVADLSGLAPNLDVRQSAGSAGIPAFSMRGITSYGVVPGSDKETSIYLDGVYISSTAGSTFDLPDIQRIEVLRGPQGTLFGRNATAGAISVVTRSPTGNFEVNQEVSVGNYNEIRSRTTIDSPTWGPFTAYASFVHDQRRGDIRNLGAGTVWDRTGPNTGEGVQYSPQYLGDKDENAWFSAVKFEPTDSFTTTYKFDYEVNHFTPTGVAPIVLNTKDPEMGVGAGLATLLGLVSSPPALDTSARRPDAVNNSFSTPGVQHNEGHTLTSELLLTDTLRLKNIAAYRQSDIFSASQIDGLGGLVIPGLAQVLVTVDNILAANQQWSDELQLNYDSKWLHLTSGALFFRQRDVFGAPPGFPNNFAFALIPLSGRLPLGDLATSYNRAHSVAGYTQAEVQIAPRFEFVGGIRVTTDRKSGTYVSGGTYVPGPGDSFTTGTFINQLNSSFDYGKTKTTYSAGLNYKPSEYSLIYGKYSTGYVSGGAVGPVSYAPETVGSWEVGAKGDFLDHRLRSSLALFYAKYENLQSAQGGSNVGQPELGTVIIDQGDEVAKGVEWDASALPVKGVTLGASLGYTHVSFGTVNPILIASAGGAYGVTLIPTWTSDLSAQYETPPLFREARLVFRTDANWRDKELTDANSGRAITFPVFAPLAASPATWLVNARVALEDIKMGPTTGEIALWGRNLSNSDVTQFPLTFLSYAGSADFQPARTFGADFSLKF
jgi:iron complex outermembrane recepter protein